MPSFDKKPDLQKFLIRDIKQGLAAVVNEPQESVSRVMSVIEAIDPYFKKPMLEERLEEVKELAAKRVAGDGKVLLLLGRTFVLREGGGLSEVKQGTGKQSVAKVIANGSFKIAEIETHEDGDFERTIYRGEVKVSGVPKPFKIEVDSKTYNNDVLLREALRAQTKIAFKFDEKEMAALRLVAESQGQAAELTKSSSFGWDADSNYFSPSVKINKDGIFPNTEKVIELPEKSAASRLNFAFFGPDEDPIKFMKGYFENLLALVDQGVMCFLLAHFFLAPIHRLFRGLPPPFLWLHGHTGDGKTFAVLSLQNLFGDFSVGDEQAMTPWTSTPKGIAATGAKFKDTPFPIDDYKEGNYSSVQAKREIATLVQNIFDRTARVTLSRTRTFNDQPVVAGLPISTGEDLPPLDAAGFARLAVIRFPSQPKNFAAGSYLQNSHLHAKKIMPLYIHWFLNQERAIYLGYLTELTVKLRALILGHQNDQRIASLAAQYGMAFKALSDFLVTWDVWPAEMAGQMQETFGEELRKHVVKMAAYAKEQTGASTFLRLLQGLIHSGAVKITGTPLVQSCKPNAEEVGFVLKGGTHEGSVYFFPDIAVTIVGKHFQDTKVDFSVKTLGQQLHDQGHFSRPKQGDGYQVKVRREAITCNVWPIKPESLGLEFDRKFWYEEEAASSSLFSLVCSRREELKVSEEGIF